MWFCLLKILASAVWQETESELQSFALAQQHYQRASDDHDHQDRKKKDRDLAHDQELKVLTHLGEEFWCDQCRHRGRIELVRLGSLRSRILGSHLRKVPQHPGRIEYVGYGETPRLDPRRRWGRNVELKGEGQ